MTVLTTQLSRAEAERSLLRPPEAWQAYDYFLRATEVLGKYWSSFEKEDLYETRRLLQRSLSLDPDYGRAHATLAYTYTNAYVLPIDGDHQNPACLDRAYSLVQKAVQLDPGLPHAHACLGLVLTHRQRYDASIAAFERAIELNPNFIDWRFAVALVRAGEAQKAICVLEQHMRLDPHYPPFVVGWLGFARFLLGDDLQAVPPLLECTSRAPRLLRWPR